MARTDPLEPALLRQPRLALRRGLAALAIALLAAFAAMRLGSPPQQSAAAETSNEVVPGERAVLEPAGTLVLPFPPLQESAAIADTGQEAEPQTGVAAAEPAARPASANEDAENEPAAAPAPEQAADTVLEQLAQVPVAASDGYRLQLGVFGDPGNAVALQRQLARQGLPAGVQSRVVLGPFPSREAAHEAQSQLKARGLDGGMLLPPQRR